MNQTALKSLQVYEEAMSISKKAMFSGLVLSGASHLALAAPFAIEGKLSQMNVDVTTLATPGAGNHLICNGSTIYLSPTTVYSTPTGTITPAQLVLPTPFPGKTPVAPDAPSAPNSQASGFIGGTCIIEGDEDSTPTGRVATNVFVEVAENVLVGLTSNSPGTPFEIMGVKVVLLAAKPADGTPLPAGYVEEPGGRVIAVPVTNATGMKVDINTVKKGDESSAEGYLGSLPDGSKVFYSHAVVTTGGDPLDAQPYPVASIQRADLTFSNSTTVKLDIRGGCTFVDASTTLPMVIQVDRGTGWINANGQSSLNATTATCTKDPATGQGTYRYRNDTFKASATAVPSTMPTKVRAFVGPAPADGTAPHYSENFMLNRLGFK
jgi:hypothetical protein